MNDDPLLRRLERDAVVACLVMAAVAVVARGGALDAALGVLAGGLLIGVSYWAIKSAIDGLIAAATRQPPGGETGTAGDRLPPGIGWPMLKLTGRYALLLLIAYVMIARLRLHPIGLLAGASSMVAAAAAAAVRAARRPAGRPR